MFCNDYAAQYLPANQSGKMSQLNITDPQLAEYKRGINTAVSIAIKQLNPDGLKIKNKVVLALKQVVMFFINVEPKNAAEAAFHKIKLTEVLTAILSQVERMMAKGKELDGEIKTLWEENKRLKAKTEKLKAKNKKLEEKNERLQGALDAQCANC